MAPVRVRESLDEPGSSDGPEEPAEEDGPELARQRASVSSPAREGVVAESEPDERNGQADALSERDESDRPESAVVVDERHADREQRHRGPVLMWVGHRGPQNRRFR
jgi:hypothetical protein